MTIKPFKLIIIVILIIIIIYFIINNKKEHQTNNSEVELSSEAELGCQTLAQLLSNNKISVKPIDSTVNIEDILNTISKNVDAEGRIHGYLPSNIIYDNGIYRDTNNRFTINPDGTFSSNDFIFQEGIIKNTNNTVLYDPNTKKLKYNNVTYDGIDNNLKENDNLFTLDNSGQLIAGEIIYDVDGTIRQKNNRFNYNLNRNELKAFPDASNNYNFLMDNTSIQSQYDPIKKRYNVTLNNDNFTINTNNIFDELITYNKATNNYNNTIKLMDVSENILVDINYPINCINIIDSPNFYDEVIILKKAADVNKYGPLNIRKIFFYDMSGYSLNTTKSDGTLLTYPNDFDTTTPVSGVNMDSTLTADNLLNLLVDDNTLNYSGLGTTNVDNVIRIKFKKPRNLATIRIDNRLDGNQKNIMNTIIYFRKNGNSLAKLELKAPTHSNGNINITSNTTINDFPLYKTTLDILNKRKLTINGNLVSSTSPPTDASSLPNYSNHIRELDINSGFSLWRFFGTGYIPVRTYSSVSNTFITSGNFSWRTLYNFRPWIALPVPSAIY
jgi:hypothetical protein